MAFRIVVANALRLAIRGAGRGACRLPDDRRAGSRITSRRPRANGYQSLSIPASPSANPATRRSRCRYAPPRCIDGGRERGRRPLDLQARPMRGGNPGRTSSAIRWVQDLLEILDNSTAPDEFLENTKLELYKDEVFCFTPKGPVDPACRVARPRSISPTPSTARSATPASAPEGQRQACCRCAMRTPERRPGRDHGRASGNTPNAAMGTLLPSPARPAPAYAATSSSSSASRTSTTTAAPRSTKAFRQEGAGRVREDAGDDAEGVEAGDARRSLRRRRQRQSSAPRRCCRRGLPRVAPNRSAPPACCRALTQSRHKAGRSRGDGWMPVSGLVSGHGDPIRRLLSPDPRRPHRGDRRHRQGRHHPQRGACPTLGDVSPPPPSGSSTSIGTRR